MTAAQASAGTGAEANGRLQRLAALGPIFRNPTTIFGTWEGATGKGTDKNLSPRPGSKPVRLAIAFLKYCMTLVGFCRTSTGRDGSRDPKGKGFGRIEKRLDQPTKSNWQTF